MACQESAGGILACLSEHAGLRLSGSHSFTLSFLSTSVKRFARKEGGKKRIKEVAERYECVELLKRDGLCLCVLLKEE